MAHFLLLYQFYSSSLNTLNIYQLQACYITYLCFFLLPASLLQDTSLIGQGFSLVQCSSTRTWSSVWHTARSQQMPVE